MKQSGEVFTAQDFAVFTRLQKQQVIPMLIDMANKGLWVRRTGGARAREAPGCGSTSWPAPAKVDTTCCSSTAMRTTG